MRSVLFFMGALMLVGLFYAGKRWYFKPKFTVGEVAVAFDAQLQDGRNFALADLRGNYVLLDFWGSWCPPCRRENPEIAKVYQAFRDKTFESADGFEIVSIGIETDKDQWQKAIRRDGLKWPYHLSELNRFDSRIAQLYGVKEIPTKYLINPEGRIVAVNPSVEQLKNFLSGRLQ